MSLYYGLLPPDVKPDPLLVINLHSIFGYPYYSDDNKSFQSSRVQLWKTTPSTVEGVVPDWELISDIGSCYLLINK